MNKYRFDLVDELDNDEWESTIGYERESIKPVLTLLNYRVHDSVNLEGTIYRLLEHDYVPSNCSFISRTIIIPLLAILLHFLTRFNSKKTCAPVCVLVSNTFEESKRYEIVKSELLNRISYYSIGSFVDSIDFSATTRLGCLYNSIKRLNNPHSLPFLGFSVSGFRLKKLCSVYCKYWIQSKRCGEHVDSLLIEKLFDGIEKEFLKRKKKVKKWLKDKNIDAFVTINQFKLRDLIIIEACHDLGIKTINMDHAVMQIAASQSVKSVPIKSINFTELVLVCNSNEEDFRNRHFDYYNPVYCMGQSITSCGFLELTYEYAIECLKKYRASKRIVYMESGWSVDFCEKGFESSYEEYRKKVLYQLKELSDRTGYKVRVRYRPYWREERRTNEKKILDDYGFEISESIPQNLMQDVVESYVVISEISNVLFTSSILGRKTYMIVEKGNNCCVLDKRINTVNVDDISELKLDDILYKEVDIDKNDFFNADVFFKMCKRDKD